MKPNLSSLWVSLALTIAGLSFAEHTYAQAPLNPGWRQARGQQVETILGDRLPEVAARYGLSDEEFHDLVQRDKSLSTDAETNLFYACPPSTWPAPPPSTTQVVAAGTSGNTSETISPGPYPSSQTFLLHSRAASTKKIYLDFDGHTTSGTPWNTSFNAGADFITPPFDTDGVVSTSFSTAELDRIQFIWKRVVEDFAPFDVDVTTEDPGAAGLIKTDAADAAYGTRVCIGGSSMDWFKSSAGGVAYIGAFNWNTDTPCYIFPAQLGNGAEKYVAEATSHEIGHTLGLNHDGQLANGSTPAVEYYGGHADWAPIMGTGYYMGTTQWSKGEYTLANNTQDDLAVMQTYGASLRVDDFGGTTMTASPLAAGTAVADNGVISSRTDLDYFRFNTGAGTVGFNLTTGAPDADVDVALSLYNGAGTLVTTANPTGLAGALTTTVATAGTYYLAVDGAGLGTGTTGYTDYASQGQYYMTGTLVASTNQPPTVVAGATPTTGTASLTVVFSSNGTLDAGGSIASYKWDFGDGTAQSTVASPSHVYTTAGTFVATLLATDNGGFSNSAKVTIVVNPAAAVTMSVNNIAMSKTTTTKGTTAKAVVTIKNNSGVVVSGAVVTGSWSGLTTGTASVTTTSTGLATFTSALKLGPGNFVFTVTNVVKSGTTYNAANNVETSDSIPGV